MTGLSRQQLTDGQTIRDTDELMAPEYIELLEKIWRLNRVHNSDEFEMAAEAFRNFCAAHMRGEARIHHYKPGNEYNFWKVPKRWNVKSFRLTGPDGLTIATEKDHPLVICPYSTSVKATLTREELLKHIHTRPDLPEAYVFYFRRMYRHWEEGWDISLPYKVVETLVDGTYEIEIDVEFTDEGMPVFEYELRGKSPVVVYCIAHLDHPGMVNDSLSGCLALLMALHQLERKHSQLMFSYRLLLVPEIIGSAIWLKEHENEQPDLAFGLSSNMTSHDAPFAFCTSKHGSSFLDLAIKQALIESGAECRMGSFHAYPDCGDEISFDTVGYNIPTTTLSRVGVEFAHYHTSLDDLASFLQPECKQRHSETVEILVRGLELLEANRTLHASFIGLPCLSNPKLDLYLDSMNINNVKQKGNDLVDLQGKIFDARAFMEFYLSKLARKGTTVLEIAHEARLPFSFVNDYSKRFEQCGLIRMEPVDRIEAEVGLPNVALRQFV